MQPEKATPTAHPYGSCLHETASQRASYHHPHQQNIRDLHRRPSKQVTCKKEPLNKNAARKKTELAAGARGRWLLLCGASRQKAQWCGVAAWAGRYCGIQHRLQLAFLVWQMAAAGAPGTAAPAAGKLHLLCLGSEPSSTWTALQPQHLILPFVFIACGVDSRDSFLPISTFAQTCIELLFCSARLQISRQLLFYSLHSKHGLVYTPLAGRNATTNHRTTAQTTHLQR